MAAKSIIFLSTVLIVQVISAQKFGLTNPNYGFGPPNSRIPVMNGGGFQVTSFSPISATGISVTSQNLIEGPLAIGGQLPLLGAVSFESNVPSRGTAAVNYCCGNQQVGINQLLPSTGIGGNCAGRSIGVPGISVPGLSGSVFVDPIVSSPALAGPNLPGLFMPGTGSAGPVLASPCLSGLGPSVPTGVGLPGPDSLETRPIISGPVITEPVLYRSITGHGTQLCPDCNLTPNIIY